MPKDTGEPERDPCAPRPTGAARRLPAGAEMITSKVGGACLLSAGHCASHNFEFCYIISMEIPCMKDFTVYFERKAYDFLGN